MKSELLPYYERELVFIRQMAGEFAEKYPERAGSLKLNSLRSEDPHVERLIEAFAYLAARIQHKIDDEFPEITSAVLDLLYPHYLRPLPSAFIAQFVTEPDEGIVSSGVSVPKGTTLYSRPVGGTPCRFRTCYPVTLWPITVSGASIIRAGSGSAPLPSDAMAAIRIELSCQGRARFKALDLRDLRFYLSGDAQVAHTLYELLFNNALRAEVCEPSHRQPVVLPRSFLTEVGFRRDEGVLPYSDRSFPGYRLLQEYFYFPQKFLFFDLHGMDRLVSAGCGDRAEITIFLSEFERRERLALLEQAIGPETFQLGCAPAVNLFERSAEPIRLTQAQYEYRIIPDVHYPLATEVYSVDRVLSTAPYSEEPREFQPFYSFRHGYDRLNGEAYWYATRRASEKKGDAGTEMYLSLVDLSFQPSLPPVETLTLHVTCTNRDLAARLPGGGEFGDWDTESSAVVLVRALRPITHTVRPPLRRGFEWRLISHLGLNYLSIVEGGHEALQEILHLYDFTGDPATLRQIEGLSAISSRRGMARVLSENGVNFCQGLQVAVEFDEEQYVGREAFLFACVLERFLALYSSINSFSQLTVKTRQRKGILKRWPPRSGEQILL